MLANPLVLATRFRSELLKLDAETLRQLIAAYAPIRAQLNGDIDRLLLEIELMDKPSRGRIERSDRYKGLIDQLIEKLGNYSAFLLVAMGTAITSGTTAGATHGAELIGSFGVQTLALNPTALEQVMAFLDKSGPLYQRIQTLAPFTAEQVARSILDGVGAGQNPRQIAGAIDRALGYGLENALRMTRTVQVYSYRYANHASFIANGIGEWQWFSRLDPARTCMSCVAMHGTIHPATETLNDHHNGLCIPIPVVGGAKLVQNTGEEWFNGQDEGTQAGMMGAGRYQAWRSGGFGFGDLSTEHQDDVYGLMRVMTTLKDLL